MKIGFFITARLKSTRLKNKILLDLDGKEIIQRVIERCKKVAGIDGVVLCTSTNSQDSPLYKFALKNDIEFFAGSENDVLKRLEGAANYFGYDAFLSITADNPLFSIQIAEIILNLFRNKSYDYIYTKGLPVGLTPYFLKTDVVRMVNQINNQEDTEIWGPFVNQTDIFNILEIIVSNNIFHQGDRLTVDYFEDFALINTIYRYFKNDFVDLVEIMNFYKFRNTETEINKKYKQSSLAPEIIKEIESNLLQKRNSIFEIGERINFKFNPGKEILNLEFNI